MKKVIEVQRGKEVPDDSKYLQSIEKIIRYDKEYYSDPYGNHSEQIPVYATFDVYEVTLTSQVDDFYNLLKSSIKGRVINGNMDGCILESELKELYEQIRRSRE